MIYTIYFTDYKGSKGPRSTRFSLLLLSTGVHVLATLRGDLLDYFRGTVLTTMVALDDLWGFFSSFTYNRDTFGSYRGLFPPFVLDGCPWGSVVSPGRTNVFLFVKGGPFRLLLVNGVTSDYFTGVSLTLYNFLYGSIENMDVDTLGLATFYNFRALFDTTIYFSLERGCSSIVFWLFEGMDVACLGAWKGRAWRSTYPRTSKLCRRWRLHQTPRRVFPC